MRRVNSQELHRYSIDDFSGGINTDSAKTLPNEISIGTNFNLTQRGLLEVRGGSETKNSSNLIPVTSGIGPTSLFELWTRDLATGVKTRHQFGTAKTNLFSIQTTGDTLVVTGLTNLDTGLTNDLVPSVAKMQNKAFLVNGKESRWTDGITSEEVGVEMPTVDPVHNTSYATGGGMSDGTYRFYYAYGRSTNYGFYGEVGDYVEVTLSGGGAAQKVSIDCKATNSTSTSADKIYLFRTKPGDNASWYQVNTASNPDDNSTVTVECLLGDNEILDTTLYDEDHTPPISGVKYIQAGGNRMYYADDNYVYYSKPNLPECVPALNIIKFSEDDGENITSIGIILNYILVTKQTSTYIIDMSVVGEHDPILISNNIGCVSHRTMEPLMNGQITMWLSQEGFVATDGVQVTSVVKDKIYYDVSTMDYSNADSAFAIYYKAKRQYVCYVPYLTGNNKIWVFSADKGGFTTHIYPADPSCFANFTNENDVERMVMGYSSTTNGYIDECDMADNDDNGTDIDWELKTPFTSLDSPDIEKSFRLAHTEWNAESPTIANISLGVNGTDNMDTGEPMVHPGAGQFDNSSHSFDDPLIGFDMSGQITTPTWFASTGNSFNVAITGSDDVGVTIKSITISYRLRGERLYNG